MDLCWTDPRIRSRHKADFVQKFGNFKANPRALCLKKYTETLKQMGGFGSSCHVQSVYSVVNQRNDDGRIVPRLVELKSQKAVIPLEDVFDVIERIHLQHNHICNIAKFYRVLQDETNLATGNISFEMVKDFIAHCQTCILNSQQKKHPIQNNVLFAPSVDLPPPKSNAQISILSNGISNLSETDPRLKNGLDPMTQNVEPTHSFAVPGPSISTPVNLPSCPTPLPSNSGSSINSSNQNLNISSNWMPIFTSTPLATKAAQPRLKTDSIFDIASVQTPHTLDQIAACMNDRIVTTHVPNQNNFAITKTSTKESSDAVKQIEIIEVKKEVQTIEDIIQSCVNNAVNEFIFNDSECRKIMVDLALKHFASWQLKESNSNPGDYYFFHRKNGKCQWNEPDEWVNEIKNRVSQDKRLLIEEANNLEEFSDDSDIIEQQPEKDNVVDSPIELDSIQHDKEIIQPSEIPEGPGCSSNYNEHGSNNCIVENIPESETFRNEPICSSTELSNNDSNKNVNESIFLKPFNTTSSFMAALGEGQTEDETMDIANFIEQFEDDLESESNFVNENISPPETSLNVPICSTTENNVKMRELNNEKVIDNPKKFVKKAEEQYNQTAKKSVSCSKISRNYVVTGRERLDEALNNKKTCKEVENSNGKLPPIFKHLPLKRFRVFVPNVNNLLSDPELDLQKLKNNIKKLEEQIKKTKQKGTFVTQPSNKKRSIINTNNYDNVNTPSTSAQKNKRLISTKNPRKINGKKFKKNKSAPDLSFSDCYRRRSSKTVVGENLQLYICVHCPSGAHQNFTNHDDYKLHIVARHKIVTDDCKSIREYLKKQRQIDVFNFFCEECNLSFDHSSAVERAKNWMMHRMNEHGIAAGKEDCAKIIGKISESSTRHPFLNIKKEEPNSTDDEEDNDWNPIKNKNFSQIKRKNKTKKQNTKAIKSVPLLKKEVFE